MMTRKAHALGMSRTTYVNASGLPDDRQITTARDLTILGRVDPRALPLLLPFLLDAELHLCRARSCRTTITCSAASRAWTASRPAIRAPRASTSCPPSTGAATTSSRSCSAAEPAASRDHIMASLIEEPYRGGRPDAAADVAPPIAGRGALADGAERSARPV